MSTAAFFAVGAVLSVAGGVMQAQAQINQGKAAKDAAEYNADLALTNAKAAKEQAAFDATQIRRKQALLSGRQRAEQGASGTVLSGSFLDVYMDSAIQGELEAMLTEYRGDVQAWSFQNEASLLEASGDNALSSAKQGAIGTILSSTGGAVMSIGMAASSSGAGASKTSSSSNAPSFSGTSYSSGRSTPSSFQRGGGGGSVPARNLY